MNPFERLSSTAILIARQHVRLSTCDMWYCMWCISCLFLIWFVICVDCAVWCWCERDMFYTCACYVVHVHMMISDVPSSLSPTLSNPLMLSHFFWMIKGVSYDYILIDKHHWLLQKHLLNGKYIMHQHMIDNAGITYTCTLSIEHFQQQYY